MTTEECFDPNQTARFVRPPSRVMERIQWRKLTDAKTREDRRAVLGALLRVLAESEDLGPDDLHDVLALALGKLEEAIGAEAGFVLGLDREAGRADVLAALRALGRREECARQEEALEERQLPLGTLGVFADVAWEEAPRALQIDEGETPAPLQEVLCGPIRTALGVPLRLRRGYTGLLLLVNHRQGEFGPADVSLAREVGDYAQRAIQRGLGLRGPFSDDERAEFMATLSGCPRFEPPDDFEVDEALCQKVGTRALARYRLLPLGALQGRSLRAAVLNPLDLQSFDDFHALTGWRVGDKMVAPRGWLEQTLLGLRTPRTPRAQGDEVERLSEGLASLDETTSEALSAEVSEHSPPIVRLAHQLIREAYTKGASDLHLEANERDLAVRYRVDGVCRERLRLPKSAARPLIARIKVMSQLDLTEHRRPQDGRLPFKRYAPDVPIDLRVSVLPTLHGESVCLRILDSQRAVLPLDRLGFSEFNLEVYRRTIRTPYGMVLHCGPTGSGKSMTLYAALNEIQDPRWKVLTVEDPVEYTLPGIQQVPVRPELDVRFAQVLRSFLRHDPDIILVGEIRDAETAKIAVEASLTGHLLLSTLHTNDATTAVARLIKLDVEPFLVSQTLIAVCAQRLLRRLCVCAERVPPSDEHRQLLARARNADPIGEVGRPRGCPECDDSGYRGRIGTHELMLVSSRLRKLIGERAPSEALTMAARQQGMRTLFEDCMEKAKAQITSME